MRNMSLGITAFVVSVGMISVGAQGRNFSGTWVIDSEKTMAAAQATAGETGTRVARGVGGGGGGAAAGGVVSGGGVGRARGTSTGEVTAAGTGGGGAGGERVAAGGIMTAAGGGGRGGAVGVVTDTVITMDATTFSINNGATVTSYPLNGDEVTVPTRGTQTAKARASWKGDTLVIEQTLESPNGPVTSTTSWYLEGDSLVRLTTRRTYFKKK